jgi:hypothetical protein
MKENLVQKFGDRRNIPHLAFGDGQTSGGPGLKFSHCFGFLTPSLHSEFKMQRDGRRKQSRWSAEIS